jgi:hypothetical protein
MNLFTVTKFEYPKPITDSFKEITDNYIFFYDDEKTYEKFITENIITDFSFDSFKEIKQEYKKICFVLYILYIKGGIFIDLNVIPNKNISLINLESEVFICIQSIINKENLFLGVLSSNKGNIINLDLIKSIHRHSVENININLCQYINTFLQKYDQSKIKILKEILKPNYIASSVDNNNIEYFDHYYNSSYYYKFPYTKKVIQKNSDVKIGITLLVFKNTCDFFTNGINQNSLYLCELLLNIGFDAYFIIQDERINEINPETLKKELYDERFKYVKYSEILSADFNIIITLSFSYSEKFILNYLKHTNTKHIGYFCGNSYIIDTEMILYNQHKKKQNDGYDFTIDGQTKYDEIWSIPQMSEINLNYWSILHRCKCIEVPFIWSKNAIKLSCIVHNCKEEDLMYRNRGENKKIAIFEPNISIMKWALPAVLITEKCYRNNKKIQQLYITNTGSDKTNDMNMKQFNKLVFNLDIVKDKKCSIEARYNTLSFMSKHSDIAVSHQWGNPLNYLYFDLAWMGWPIIHNADKCKDVGYFYNNFNYDEGSNMLNYVLANHDNNIDEYIKNNRKNIDKFLTTNEDLQKIYENLIYNVINK